MKLIEAKVIPTIIVNQEAATGRDGYYSPPFVDPNREPREAHEIGIAEKSTEERILFHVERMQEFIFFDERYVYIRNRVIEILKNVSNQSRYLNLLNQSIFSHEETHLIQELRMQASSLIATHEKSVSGFKNSEGKKVHFNEEEEEEIALLVGYIEQYVEIQAYSETLLAPQTVNDSVFINLYMCLYRVLDYLNHITRNTDYKTDKLFYFMPAHYTAFFAGTVDVEIILGYLYSDNAEFSYIDEIIYENMLTAINNPQKLIEAVKNSNFRKDFDLKLTEMCFKLRDTFTELAKKYDIPDSELLYKINSPKMVTVS